MTKRIYTPWVLMMFNNGEILEGPYKLNMAQIMAFLTG